MPFDHRRDAAPRASAPLHWSWLILFLALVVGGGTAIGLLTGPDAWFAGLIKPAFQPPDWLFAPVWTFLYICIAIAGWRAFGAPLENDGLLAALWAAQLVFNFAWSPVFFGGHAIAIALLVIVLLLATILLFIATAWRRDRVAALLFLPYAAWVAFATLLNAALWELNPAA
jgi:tryptophan-rich sensory protein